MTGRLIAVGDIHGCHIEFAEMLELLELQGGDRLVLLGDLVNRGPDSNRVIDLARAAGSTSLLGNHELRLLKYRRTGDRKYIKERDLETFDRLRPEDWAYLESMPLTFEEPELNTVFVHGGFLPNEPWQKQPAEVVTRIQVVDSDGRPRKRADAPDAPPWATRRGPRSTSSSGPSGSTPAASSAEASPPSCCLKSGLSRSRPASAISREARQTRRGSPAALP